MDIHFSKRARNIALFTLFFMVTIHAYRYFSPMFSHDSLLFSAASEREWQISLGRFMQPIYWRLRGSIGAPYIVGMFSYLWVMLSAYIVSKLLDIRSNMAQFLLSGVMVGSLTLTATNATYINWADIFMLALLLNVFAAYLLLKPVKKLWVFAPVLLMTAMALYQAYIQVYVALVMIWAVKQILAKGNSLQRTLLRCVKSAGILLLSMVVYAVVWKYILKVTGIQPERGYNGLTEVGHYEGVCVPALLVEAYEYPFWYLWNVNARNRIVVLAVRIGILSYAVCATVYVLVKRRCSLPETVTVLGALALLPLGMNCVYLISKGLVHDLILYSYCLVDVYAIAVTEYAIGLTEEAPRQSIWTRWIGRGVIATFPLMFCLLFLDKTLYANQLYLRKDLEYDATLSVMTRVVDRLEQLDGYEAGKTPVAIKGLLVDSVFDQPRAAFSGTEKVTGMEKNLATTYEDTHWDYWSDVMGYPIVRSEHPEEVVNLPEVRDMPSFPQKGSVAMVQGVAVIKFSD